MTKPQLTNLQQTVANMILIINISNSNNLFGGSQEGLPAASTFCFKDVKKERQRVFFSSQMASHLS